MRSAPASDLAPRTTIGASISSRRSDEMTAPRFFVTAGHVPAQVGATIALPESAAHHATRVLRLAAGAALTLFDGTGGEYAATLVHADRRSATVRVEGFVPVDRESPLAVTLAQGIAANDAMDYAIRKATELGATSIQPLVTARSAPLPPGDRGDRRLAHWRGIVIAACEQCGRNRVPEVSPPRALGEWLQAWEGSGIVFAPDADGPVGALAQPPAPLALLIGPEGGFDARELRAVRARGFHPVRFGPRVLRTETAAAAALAVLQSIWGDGR
jgi:16S rRNA (uracil1498-N3)-methyltransferase